MARKVKDFGTLDLFRDIKLTPIVRRFEQEQIKAVTLEGRLRKALSRAITESHLNRSEIAKRMSEHIGEGVTTSQIDSWTAPSKENSHRIPAVHLISLALVIEDMRALNTLLAEADHIIIPDKYEALIRRERARELQEELNREAALADSEWRARR